MVRKRQGCVNVRLFSRIQNGSWRQALSISRTESLNGLYSQSYVNFKDFYINRGFLNYAYEG